VFRGIARGSYLEDRRQWTGLHNLRAVAEFVINSHPGHAVTPWLHNNQCKMHNFLEVGFYSIFPSVYLIMYQIGTQGLHKKQGVRKRHTQ